MATLIQASTPSDLQLISELFREYAVDIGVDLCFQNFEEELRTLPGKYAPPRGRLYLAFEESAVSGCAALRPIESDIAEMKRLYIRPRFRQRGLGRLLAEKLIEDARQIGYRSIYLDTLSSMSAARSLYASLGFLATPNYYENPLPDVCYLKLDLA